MALSPQWLDELRARVTLSSVVQRTTKLQRAGNEWKACCPFHDEKTPSFTVSDAKGFYHCFGCGAHGDVIRWMTDQRGLAFMDAVKELAAEAGLEVPAADPRAMQRAEQQAGLHEVMQAAQDWFRASLDTPAGARAREYLRSRGFDAHTLERFGFGYAPNARNAIAGALKQFDRAMLIEGGLLIAADEKEPYDRFRDRLTIPIHDPRGRVIGFAARILDADKKDAPKYLNSPDTPLFDKGRTLFNLHRAGPAARKSGRLVVVEGQMDAVAMAAAGFEEAVAPMGTALTEPQLQLLWRLIDAPVLCFDGDSAGQRAAMRAIARALPLLAPGKTLSIARLPAGLDPDDLIKQQGVEAIEALLAEPASLLDALWAFERDAAPLRTPEDKVGLKARLIAHCDAIQNSDIRSLYRRDLLRKYSEFAFPARDWSGYANVRDIRTARNWGSGGGGGFPRVNPFGGKASEQLKSDFSNPDKREQHLHRRLGAAIVAGLLVYPEYVILWAETLMEVSDIDPRLEAFVNAAFDADILTTEMLESILEQANLKRPTATEWDNLAFPFAWPPQSGNQAQLGLEKAMRLYVGWPQVRRALRHATDVLSQTFSDEAFREQQRLRGLAEKMKLEVRHIDLAA